MIPPRSEVRLRLRNTRRTGRLIAGNHIHLLQNGAEFFPALIAAIDVATIEVRLETYIFYLDESGTLISDALMRASRRGVTVALLLDGVGSRLLPASWFDAMKQARVEVLIYRPPYFGWLTNPLNLRRLHRKITVIDARKVFLGGINVMDDFVPVAWPGPRLDYSVQISGPIVSEIYRNVVLLWRLVARSHLQPALARLPMLVPATSRVGNARLAFLVRDNFRHRRSIENAYLAAIANARDDILIASAYFLPGRRFRQALKKAIRRGVRVRLLMQGRTDHPFFLAASRGLYADLLSLGIVIYEYSLSELHAKVAVIDKQWVTIGSSNIDPFSLLLAREANIVSDDRALAEQLEASLQRAIDEGAEQLESTHWQRRSWIDRLRCRLAYASVRWILGVAGFSRWV
ncbi:MAG: cardiolipin synthase ClsB [Thiobacillus sp.]